MAKGLTKQMHSDGKKRCSFVALPFAAGDLRRYVHVLLSTTGRLLEKFNL